MNRNKQFIALILGFILVMVSLVATSCAVGRATVPRVYTPQMYTQVEVNFDSFHQSLSPYGHWVMVGSYGTCWRPSGIAIGWRPYFDNGYWAYTEYGWTWVSLEPWGNVAFHYGSWLNDPYYGWVWVPGYVWGPAWVTWVYTDFYIGWAPLHPGFRFHPHHGYTDHHHRPHHNDCVFVPTDRMTGKDLRHAAVPFERNVGILQAAQVATTIGVVNNQVVNHGPSTSQIERLKLHRTPINTISGERGFQPRPLRVLDEKAEIDLSPTKVNNEQGRRVIKDFDREERGARADRERQLNVEKDKSDRIKINPEPRQQRRIEEPGQVPATEPNKEQRRIEREQRRQQEEQPRQQEQQRNQQQEQRNQEQRRMEREQRRQQEEMLRNQQQEQQRRQQQEQLRQQQEQKKQERLRERQDQKPYRIEQQPDPYRNQQPNQQRPNNQREEPRRQEGERKQHNNQERPNQGQQNQQNQQNQHGRRRNMEELAVVF